VANLALAIGTVDDVHPIVALLCVVISLHIEVGSGTAPTPPYRNAVTAILSLDRA
jgi:hypothetical protein